MFNWLLILTLFFSSPLFADRGKVPVLYKGRIRPYATLPKEITDPEALPLKKYPWQKDAGSWSPLSSLREKQVENFTPYSQALFEKIRQAYLDEDEERLSHLLRSAYQTIAGTIYRESSTQTLRYPSQGRLAVEYFLYHFPLHLLTLFGYAGATLLFLWKKKPLGYALFLSAFFFHTLSLLLRMYVLGRPPVSNMAETILYVPWVTALIGLLFRAPLPATLTATALLLFLPMHPSFENVQAVLNSHYWLIIHVLMVVGSYGVFFFSGVLGHLYLLKRSPSHSLERLLVQTLYLGSGLLICGTILGGVWAAQSWGRFWDWDPKESWAFISSGVYLIGIHAYKYKKIGGFGLAVGSIIGLMTITFTWYGVNYILGTGLHSYGFGGGGQVWYYLYLFGEVLFLLFLPKFKKIVYKNSAIAKKEHKR